jgi:hypothetical protein
MLDIDSNIVIEKKLLVGLDGQMSTLTPCATLNTDHMFELQGFIFK